MAICEVCGNDYYLSFEVITANARHTFDSFECKIIGHGIEANKTFYCCANCARESGVTGVKDRA
jgi:hypothetical protein